MTMAMALGAGVGLGVWLLIRSFSPRPAPFSELLAALDRPGRPAATDHAEASVSRRREALARSLLEKVGVDVTRRGRDLNLLGRSPERHALDKLTGALGGVVGTILVGAGVTTAGLSLPAATIPALGAAALVGGFFLPDLLLRDQVARRRAEFRHALSAYLDLVNVILAGGGGTETALFSAAEVGDGWAFATIRRSLDRARLTNRSPWDTFADLGAELGVAELGELAASVSLAGSHGARIRQSLAAKADSLRGHQIAETESAAESATERMTIPVAVLLFGFLVFIAWPAIHQITSVSSTPVP